MIRAINFVCLGSINTGAYLQNWMKVIARQTILIAIRLRRGEELAKHGHCTGHQISGRVHMMKGMDRDGKPGGPLSPFPEQTVGSPMGRSNKQRAFGVSQRTMFSGLIISNLENEPSLARQVCWDVVIWSENGDLEGTDVCVIALGKPE